MAAEQYEAYCLQCMGGGKTLGTGSKRRAESLATSHQNVYHHDVTILPVDDPAKGSHKHQPSSSASGEQHPHRPA